MDAQQELENPPAVERDVALDIAKHGLIIAPVVILVCALIGGVEGAISGAIGLGIVLVNFLVAALIMNHAAKNGPTAIGIAATGGYVLRLAVILVALFVLRNQPWINLKMLGIVLVGSHLGLLAWETKYVSLTLAAPGLRPARPTGDQ